ncbi:enoyl-CoA hydratase/isomerase family protein [Rhodococcus koreensis]
MNTTEQPVLLIEISDGLARLTINRPARMNTLSRELMEAMRQAFFRLADDPSVRVILLTSTGNKAFCAGADLKEPARHEYSDLGAYLAGQPGIFDAMRRCPQIIVSEVKGYAIGGGMQLALFSDLAYASVDSTFKLPQVSLGIFPPYGTIVRLARQIGQGRAMQMVLLGTEMDAQQALDCGLIQKVLPDHISLHEHVEDVIQTLLALPPQSIALAKDSMMTGWEMSAAALSAADRFRDYALKQDADSKRLHKDWIETN